MKKIVLAITVLSLAVACNKDDSKVKPASAFPDHLEKQSAPSTPLNDAQVNELSHFMKGFAKIPGGELLLKEKDESKSSTERRERKISVLDADGMRNLTQIKENCTIQDPIQTQTPANAMPTAGSVLKQNKVSKISGKICPVLYEESSDSTYTYSRFNYKENEKTVDTSGSYTKTTLGKQEVLSEEMSTNANYVRAIHKSSSKGNFETSNLNSSWYMEADLDSTFTTRTGATITYIGSVKYLSRDLGVGKKHAETSYLIKLHIPSAEVVLSMFAVRDGTVTTNSFNLNGRDLSETEIKNIFGKSFDLTMD